MFYSNGSVMLEVIVALETAMFRYCREHDLSKDICLWCQVLTGFLCHCIISSLSKANDEAMA